MATDFLTVVLRIVNGEKKAYENKKSDGLPN
jgi:hypothetical protein